MAKCLNCGSYQMVELSKTSPLSTSFKCLDCGQISNFSNLDLKQLPTSIHDVMLKE